MNRLTDKKGFSILEILVAITILGIGIMGLATLQSRGIRGNDLGNRTSQAIALAQDKLEELINTSRSTTFPAGTTNDTNNPVDETGSGGGMFTRSWKIQDDTPVTNAETVGVTVGSNDIGRQHNIAVNGIITSDSY